VYPEYLLLIIQKWDEHINERVDVGKRVDVYVVFAHVHCGFAHENLL
jgi:hypothetical protein